MQFIKKNFNNTLIESILSTKIDNIGKYDDTFHKVDCTKLRNPHKLHRNNNGTLNFVQL